MPGGNFVVFSEQASCVCLLYCIAGEPKAVQKKKWHQSYPKIEFLNPNMYQLLKIEVAIMLYFLIFSAAAHFTEL